jgi:D-glycero-alpha-D-manno-heptose-7-phosphate kinase
LVSQLTLVFLGRAHDSSRVHSQVIEESATRNSASLVALRDAAVAAREAVFAQDLEAFGQAMIANTEAQRSLHSALIGIDAMRVIDVAEEHGALGWKVNGAGGDGGSVTVLTGSPETKHAFEVGITASASRYKVLPIRACRAGLQVKGSL